VLKYFKYSPAVQNGTFAFSPPNACSPVDPMGHSCVRGMDNNVGFLNAGLAEVAAAFPAPRRRQHELRHQRLARQQEAAAPLAALIPLLSLPTLSQEECDEVLAVRPSKIHRNIITSCFVLICVIQLVCGLSVSGLRFKLRRVSRRQDGCALPKMEGV
jgi:hypothetical protein